MFPIAWTMVSGLETIVFVPDPIVHVSKTIVGNTHTIVGNTETIVGDTQMLPITRNRIYLDTRRLPEFCKPQFCRLVNAISVVNIRHNYPRLDYREALV